MAAVCTAAPVECPGISDEGRSDEENHSSWTKMPSKRRQIYYLLMDAPVTSGGKVRFKTRAGMKAMKISRNEQINEVPAQPVSIAPIT